MVEVIKDSQFRAYSDFDNRALSRTPTRAALDQLMSLIGT
jgi:hypothetical protein